MTIQLVVWANRLTAIRDELGTLYLARLQCEMDYNLVHAKTTVEALLMPASNETTRKANVELKLAESSVVSSAYVSLCKVKNNIAILEMEHKDIRLAMHLEAAQVWHELVE